MPRRYKIYGEVNRLPLRYDIYADAAKQRLFIADTPRRRQKHRRRLLPMLMLMRARHASAMLMPRLFRLRRFSPDAAAGARRPPVFLPLPPDLPPPATHATPLMPAAMPCSPDARSRCRS